MGRKRGADGTEEAADVQVDEEQKKEKKEKKVRLHDKVIWQAKSVPAFSQ